MTAVYDGCEYHLLHDFYHRCGKSLWLIRSMKNTCVFFAGIILISVEAPGPGACGWTSGSRTCLNPSPFRGGRRFQGKTVGAGGRAPGTAASTYEEAVAMDIRRLADTAGFSVRSVVTIETDRDSPLYGHVTCI